MSPRCLKKLAWSPVRFKSQRFIVVALCVFALMVAGGNTNAETPHPAVARIVVEEQGGTAYGSGVLIDAREAFGLVITNWHVVRDASGPVQVVFPSGFRSQARALKLDKDWDLAALVIWRPPTQPAPLADSPPQQGDRLTICGYGQGDYRSATGQCTDYYAPKLGLPQELVELDVEARQGDSGGPIFNSRGQVAGILFGAGQGTTLGSFGGRVESFLASLAPGIGDRNFGPKSPATAVASLPPAPADTVEPINKRPASSPWPRYASGQSIAANQPPVEEFGLTPIEPTPINPTPNTANTQLYAEGSKSTELGDRYSDWTPPAASGIPDWDKDANNGLSNGFSSDFNDGRIAEQLASASALPAIEPAPQTDALSGENAIALTRSYENEPDLVLWFGYAKTTLAIVGMAFLFLQFVRLAT